MTEHRPEQEEDRLPLGKVSMVLVVLVALTLANVLYSWLVLDDREAKLAPPVATPREEAVPRPTEVDRTLFDEGPYSERFLDEQRRALRSYQWVDRERGVVRIPIDRAIEMTTRGAKP